MMLNLKRLRALALLGMLTALLIGAISVQAAPLTDLTALARYAPADAPYFVAVRADQAYLETFDALLRQMAEKLGQNPDNATTILGNLESAMQNISGGELTYETGIRSWLGDSAAVTFPSVTAMLRGGQTPAIVIFAVTDRDAAAEFVSLATADQRFVPEEVDGATLYLAEETWRASYALTDDALLITTGMYSDLLRQMATNPPDAPLSADPDFAAAQDALPADDYNVFGYLNLRPAVTALGELAGPSLPVELDVPELASAMGVQSLGLTILDGRALTMDLGFVHGDGDLLEAFGLPALTTVDVGALDLGMAARARPDTLAYAQSSRAGSQAAAVLDDLARIGDPILQQYVVPALEDAGRPNVAAFVRDFRFNTVTTFIELMVEGTMGLPIDEVYALLDGQNASAVFALPDPDTYVTLESVQIMENVDAEGTGALIAGIARLLGDFRVDHEFDGAAISLPTEKPLAQMMALINPARTFNRAGPDTVITANAAALAVGSRPLVEFALDPGAESLATTEAFTYEAGFFLPEAEALLFLNIGALLPLFADDAPLAEIAPAGDREQINLALGLFDSAAFTGVTVEGRTQMRFTLTLSE